MKTLKQFFVAALLCVFATPMLAADAATGKGVINRIDTVAGIVNINHEAIPALKWPTMSMDFKVLDKHQLSTLKPGQTVSFGLVKDAKLGYVISHVEPVGPPKK
jgi:Cu/Ag efflux protein CusF